jgi:HPP family
VTDPRPVRWWERTRWALPLLVVVPMLALAGALDTSAIIFPEGAALAMGVWVLGLQGWTASRWRVLVLPPLCAAVGVALVRAELPSAVAEIAALTFGLLVLQAFDSRLAPALSAGVLPIVFDIGEWSYPLAVLTVCAAVAVLWRLIHHPAARRLDDVLPERYPWAVVASAWLVIVAWILIGGQALELSPAALAPPLFVSALEWLGRGTPLAGEGLRRWALLVGAGLAGSVAAKLVAVGWIGGALAVCATLALMWLLATPHPPALAIAIIPQILVSPDPLSYTTSIAAGAAALYLGIYAVGRAANAARLRARTA